MRALRLVALVLIASIIALGVVAEQDERPAPETATVGGIGQPDATTGTWFCPGGSGPGGRAAVALEVINAGREPAVADIVTVRSDPEPGRRSQVSVGAGERIGVAIADLAVGTGWARGVRWVDIETVVSGDADPVSDRLALELHGAVGQVAADLASRLGGAPRPHLAVSRSRTHAVATVLLEASLQ